ncbi:hypothetical protein L0636_00990 [Halomonas janggokensis]|uniref:Uncharacterized protein n=1 Tax=Vreelandella janggokensis TaxID=370767 RepID=A0ABT4IS80_9GAMM|nr:hypothetical protein [Halomonas janggokensis]MCZ0926463.1 hypothetical protein [Halomonas janggokensis]MCZ0929001.1 hypothetical protein [Halomonas janggokensis]
MQQPPLIKYNLKDRGRQYRGVERNFDIPVIVDSINSPATQERVSTRGMLGYFGHWPRVRFGMEPAEGGVAEGKSHAIEPAVVTTHLKAFDDGTVEHQTEFLDTATGQLAARMYANRVGGFSSAIDPRKPELYGFDWVNDPNYSTNRGYDLVLDSVNSGEMTFDDVLTAENAEQVDAMNRLFEMMESNMRLALDSASRYENENRELLDLLEKREESVKALIADSTTDPAKQHEKDRRYFLDSALPRFQNPDAKEQDDRDYLRLKRRMFTHV